MRSSHYEQISLHRATSAPRASSEREAGLNEYSEVDFVNLSIRISKYQQCASYEPITLSFGDFKRKQANSLYFLEFTELTLGMTSASFLLPVESLSAR